METLTAREKPKARLMYSSWVRLMSPGWMSSPAWEVSELATCAAESAMRRNRNVPTNSPASSTAWGLTWARKRFSMVKKRDGMGCLGVQMGVCEIASLMCCEKTDASRLGEPVVSGGRRVFGQRRPSGSCIYIHEAPWTVAHRTCFCQQGCQIVPAWSRPTTETDALTHLLGWYNIQPSTYLPLQCPPAPSPPHDPSDPAVE